MSDIKQKLILDITQQEIAVKDALYRLRVRYRHLKHALIILLYIILSYIAISLTLIKFSNFVNMYLYILFQLLQAIVIIICLIRLIKCIKIYNRYYVDGFSLWCKLADTADWSTVRRHFYFKNEKLSPIIDTINSFYVEFNKPLSPQRIFRKRIYYLILTLLTLYLLMVLYSILYFKRIFISI